MKTSDHWLYEHFIPICYNFYRKYHHGYKVIPFYMEFEDFVHECISEFLTFDKTVSYDYICHHVVDRFYPKGYSRKIFSSENRPVLCQCDFNNECKSKEPSQDDSFDVKQIIKIINGLDDKERLIIQRYLAGFSLKEDMKEFNYKCEVSISKKRKGVIQKIRRLLDGINK